MAFKDEDPCSFELMASKYAINAKQSFKNKRRLNLFSHKIIFIALAISLLLPLIGGVNALADLIVYYSFDFFVFSVIWIVLGLYTFSEYQLLSGIPTIKADAAAVGLCEVVGNFAPEQGDALVSPFSKEKCVYYNVELFATRIITVEGRYGPVDHSLPELIDSVEQGVPSVFTDGDGYITLDISNAETRVRAMSYVVQANSEDDNMISTFRATVEGKPEGSAKPLVGLSPYDDSLKLPNESVDAGLMEGNYYIIYERFIPADTKYFAMGYVAPAQQSDPSSKPIKTMYADKKNKIFTVLPESRDDLVAKMRGYYQLFLGGGIAMILACAILALI